MNGKLKTDIKMEYDIKEIVKGTTAKLVDQKDGKLIYAVEVEDLTYTFPIDTNDKDDVGDTVFESEYKAITLMRYVRKGIKSGELRWE